MNIRPAGPNDRPYCNNNGCYRDAAFVFSGLTYFGDRTITRTLCRECAILALGGARSDRRTSPAGEAMRRLRERYDDEYRELIEAVKREDVAHALANLTREQRIILDGGTLPPIEYREAG